LYASIRAIAVGSSAVKQARARPDQPPSRAAATKPDRRWQAFAIAACALGMGCKESMITAPLMVALYDRIFVFDSFQQAMRARRGLYAGLAATWAVLAALMWSGPRSAVGGFSTGISPWTYLLNQAQMIVHYLGLAFWPRSLVVFYGWPVSLTLGDVLPYAVLIVLLLAATIVALVRAPALGFLGAWFFITLAPTSSIVPVATEVGAERRMYLPLLALIVLAAVTVTMAWRAIDRLSLRVPSVLRGGELLSAAVLVLVAGSLAARTVARNREYASPITLARTVVDRRPTAVSRHYLAEQLALAGQHDEAMRHLRDAVAGGDSRAGYLLGFELFNAGKLTEAVQQLEAFVRTSGLPYRLVPHWLEPPVSEVITARLVLARAATMQGRWPQAEEQARIVLTKGPGNKEARLFLADALFGQERYAEAAPAYREYLKAEPGNAHALTNLGITLIADSKLEEAIVLFRRAVDADPQNPNLRRILGMALLDRGDAEGAAAQAREGVALSPNDPAIRDLLVRATSAGR
jgi:tetratricopeptide (TPR) repeat protein